MNSWAATSTPEPQARAHRPASAGGDPKQRVDDQRRHRGELHVVVTLAGVDQGGREAVERAAQGGRADADPPPAQDQEQAGRRQGEAGGQGQGQADLRAGQQRDRGQQDAGQQERGVPHQVHAVRRVHRLGDQGRQPAVGDRRRAVPHEPGELVDIAQVTDLRPAGRVEPEPPGDGQRPDQVAPDDQQARDQVRPRARLGLLPCFLDRRPYQAHRYHHSLGVCRSGRAGLLTRASSDEGTGADRAPARALACLADGRAEDRARVRLAD